MMNPYRVEELFAMTWPLQSDTLRSFVRRTGREPASKVLRGRRAVQTSLPGFLLLLLLPLLLLLVLGTAFASVCELPCNSNCPKTNLSNPICEPLSFSAEADIENQLLLSGEATNSTITVINSENLTLTCVYSLDGADRLNPVSVGEEARSTIGFEQIVAPSDNPGYQQRVPVSYKVRCEARVVNASGGNYLWCGAGCVEFSGFYQYPTIEVVREYQERKLVASTALNQALLALSEAQKLIEKVRQALELAPAGFDTSFAEYRLLQAESGANESLHLYGSASYSFDQALFENASYFAGAAASAANGARSFANEAYSSLVYYSPTSKNYLDWYVNTTGIMLGELEELLGTIEPIAENAPEILGGAFAEWTEDLRIAKDLLEEAKNKLREGREAEALGLLQRARELLLKLKQSIEKTFDRVYSELMKVAINSRRSAEASKISLEYLVNGTASFRGVNSQDFTGIYQNFERAGFFLEKARGSIETAENSTVQSQLRREINLALIRVANARVELSIALIKYKFATFKTETLVAILSILSAAISIGILIADLRGNRRKETLALVKVAALDDGGKTGASGKKGVGGGKRMLPTIDERY
ncbi:MAG: hypothetical protein V1820_00435 [archaeon]